MYQRKTGLWWWPRRCPNSRSGHFTQCAPMEIPTCFTEEVTNKREVFRGRRGGIRLISLPILVFILLLIVMTR
jgi:hypothetical protein